MRNVGRDSRGRSVAVSTLMILTSLVLGLLAGHAGGRRLAREFLEEPLTQRLPSMVRVPFPPGWSADDSSGSLIKQSRLNWIIVRPPKLTNGQCTAAYRSGERIRANSPALPNSPTIARHGKFDESYSGEWSVQRLARPRHPEVLLRFITPGVLCGLIIGQLLQREVRYVGTRDCLDNGERSFARRESEAVNFCRRCLCPNGSQSCTIAPFRLLKLAPTCTRACSTRVTLALLASRIES
jgi:hypothetical protein